MLHRAAGREGRGAAFLNFLRDVNDILYPTISTTTSTRVSVEELQQSAFNHSLSLGSIAYVYHKLQSVIGAVTGRSGRTTVTCTSFIGTVKECKFSD